MAGRFGTKDERPRLEAQARARRAAVDFTHLIVLEGGGTKKDAASRLSISRRTLLRWERAEGERRPKLGRPARRSDRPMRDALIERLGELGPATGEEPLRALFPQLARREIRDLLHRYRALYVRRNGIIVRELHWLVPGRSHEVRSGTG